MKNLILASALLVSSVSVATTARAGTIVTCECNWINVNGFNTLALGLRALDLNSGLEKWFRTIKTYPNHQSTSKDACFADLPSLCRFQLQ